MNIVLSEMLPNKQPEVLVDNVTDKSLHFPR